MPRAPKRTVVVDIPHVFVGCMQHVARLIAEGNEAATLESDDLLQCDCMCGGLIDAHANRFAFTYFGEGEATWDVILNAQEIAEIAQGSLTRLRLYRCSGSSCECLFPTEDSYCVRCDSMRHFDKDYSASLRRCYPGEPTDVIDSLRNLRRIALAIGDYVNNNGGCLPPPFTKDKDGNRLHSWRSLILPFLDLDELHTAIQFDQPWDAPVNRELAAETPEVYQTCDTPAGRTRYTAILGGHTLWPPDATRMLTDVTSGYSHTIAVMEAPRAEFCWMEPNDVDFDSLAGQLPSGDRPLPAAWIDGNVAALRDLSREQLRQLVSI